MRGAASGRAPFREQPRSHKRGQTGTGTDSRPRRPSPPAPRDCLTAAVHLRFRRLEKVFESSGSFPTASAVTPEPPLPNLGALATIALPAAQVTCGWAPSLAVGRSAVWSEGCCGLAVCAPPAAMSISALPAGPLCSSPGPERSAIPAPRPGPVRFGCSRGHVAGRSGCPRHGAAPPQLPPLPPFQFPPSPLLFP